MEALDQDILFCINGANFPYLDTLMSLISGKLIWAPLYIVILYVFFLRVKSRKNLLAILITIGVTFFLTDFCCSQLIRPIFMRLRPVCIDNPIHTMVHAVEGYRQGASYGFPSCHASNTFGLATLVWLYLRERWTTITMFSWAIIMCYSRVYLGVHYPGDVTCGALLGLFIGACMYMISLSLQMRYLKPDLDSGLDSDFDHDSDHDLDPKSLNHKYLIPFTIIGMYIILAFVSFL